MPPDRPTPPDLPTYLLDPLERQSPSRLAEVAAYATALAAWKRAEQQTDARRKRTMDAVDEDTLEHLDDRGVSMDPNDYDAVPASGAYVTVKETKPGYHYYYWQWRAGDTWENEYIAPVDPEGPADPNE